MPISTQRLSFASKCFGAGTESDQQNISVHGPQGPVSPVGPHQLSDFSIMPPSMNIILSFGIPKEIQIFEDSSSLGIPKEFPVHSASFLVEDEGCVI